MYTCIYIYIYICVYSQQSADGASSERHSAVPFWGRVRLPWPARKYADDIGCSLESRDERSCCPARQYGHA